MSRAAFEVSQVMRAVRRSIPLEDLSLPDEFYPAHLSVALIDAVFRFRSRLADHAVSAAERYCRRFGIPRTRTNRWDAPAAKDQEALTDLVRRFDELGMDRMIEGVFRTARRHPGTKLARAEYALRAAEELRGIGVEILQDIRARPGEEIVRVLGDRAGLCEDTTRMILMYSGDDDFVRGDEHIRNFVADALGRKALSAARAKNLVRRCAYELILSPRYLDHQIWCHRSAWPMAA